jgi:hypothetical protein
MKRQRIVLPGGSGQVGSVLARAWAARGHDVVVVSRAARAPSSAAPWRTVAWDGVNAGSWCDEIDGADVVVNLAGRSVNCRYGAENRRTILESRVFSTRAVGAAIANARRPPRVWLQASTATIYAHRFDAPNDDVTGIVGGDEPDAPDTWRFSIDVAKAWEAAAREVHTPHTRLVLLRSAMTMSPDAGGIFDTLLGLVRRGLGGTCGDGRQYVSWIHESDFVRALDFLVEHEHLVGAVAIASPHPLPNREFMATLRRAWGTRIGLPATRWMLEIGAVFLRTETELILKSRRVVPTRLLGAGFAFELPQWADAARELCARARVARN